MSSSACIIKSVEPFLHIAIIMFVVFLMVRISKRNNEMYKLTLDRQKEMMERQRESVELLREIRDLLKK